VSESEKAQQKVLDLRRKIQPQTYNHLAEIFISLAEIFSPPRRISVAEAAEELVYLNNPGAYVGPWQNSTTPYMIEPMDELTSRDQTAVVFVGPAQSAKTQTLILNWLAYTVAIDPGDIAIFSPTAASAKDFSFRRVSRMFRQSPKLAEKLLPQKSANNVFEKRFTNGTYLALGWPTVSQFAGRPIMRVALTDYDRMDDDVEGEGSPFGLAQKRITTFGTFGKAVAESSPSRLLKDNRWIASSKHEAPPTGGIFSLYNQGDRRKLYWPCPHCGQWFDGKFEMLEWDTDIRNTLDASRTTFMRCPFPTCAQKISFDSRDEMLARSIWLKDGESIENNTIVGEARRSLIASFWLNGVAAKFITWGRLVYNYLEAEEDFEKTGNEEKLKTFWNTDVGTAYMPKAAISERLPEVLKSRSAKSPEKKVPMDVRFLIAGVDVQGNRFEVMVLGIRPGQPFDTIVVDRFPIIKSARMDEDDDKLYVKPGTYLEDWDMLIEAVINKKYELDDGSGRYMRVRAVACDSGGKAGVTTNAYAFYRRLKTLGLANRFHLVKGDATPSNPRVRINFPDSSRKDRLAAARGDVPVLMINSNMMKDLLANRLDSLIPGQGMFVCPDWLPDSFYTELCAETRTDKGWLNLRNERNEAWDIGYYILALCLSSYIGIENFLWESAPSWADVWDKNDLVSAGNTERFASRPKAAYDFAAIGRRMA
jgi:phage terminase large subunit GpA-like protein